MARQNWSFVSLPNALHISEAVKLDSTAVLVIDLQHDFMEGGNLAVGGADYTNYLGSCTNFIELCRKCKKGCSDTNPRKTDMYICQSQDFHPPGHSSFASSHKTKDGESPAPFSTKELSRWDGTKYTQVLWPDHCIQGTKGSECIVKPLISEFVQVKGTKPEFDSYSAFLDDGGYKTGLDEYLNARGIENLIIFGLATDFCVYFSATDAVKCGFKNVYVVKDLCRAIDPNFDWNKFTENGCNIVSLEDTTDAVKSLISPSDLSKMALNDVFNSDASAVLIIDVQPDFMEGGSLAVGGADYDKYLGDCKQFIQLCRDCKVGSSDKNTRKTKLYICQSRDFHPPGHSSFASFHKNNGDEDAVPFATKELSRWDGTKYTQILWPDHCIQGTKGSECIITPLTDEYVQVKGTKPEFDSYSAFIDSGGAKTGLDQYLKGRGIENIVLFGLATDFCVYFSATDAVKCGFKNVYVIQDLCRAIDPKFDLNKFVQGGCEIVSLESVTEALTKVVKG